MYELKTKENDASVIDFIEQVENSRRRADAYTLLDFYSKQTGLPAKMWGSSIIGFGSYHYKYPTGHEGDAMLVGFSPRKAAISLYLAPYLVESEKLLDDFGKYKLGKGCVYINKVADIDLDVLAKLIEKSIKFLTKQYPDGIIKR